MTSAAFKELYQTLRGRASSGVGTIAESRQGFAKMLSDCKLAPDVRLKEISIGKLSGYWFTPPSCHKEKAILFFHGGAYTIGSTMTHQDLIGRLAKAAHMPVLGIDYRLAPEHPFPAAVEDALAAYKFLLKDHKPQNIALSGDSAGGGLVFALLLALKEEELPMPGATVTFSPWVDLTMSGSTFKSNQDKDILPIPRIAFSAKTYAGKTSLKEPKISPLFGDLKGLPPSYIQVGTHELLLEEDQKFAQKAKKAGVLVTLEVFDEMFHGWQLFASKIPEGAEAIEKSGAYLKKVLFQY